MSSAPIVLVLQTHAICTVWLSNIDIASEVQVSCYITQSESKQQGGAQPCTRQRSGTYFKLEQLPKEVTCKETKWFRGIIARSLQWLTSVSCYVLFFPQNS